eukprot:CAMPEP_0195539266 /NCGR_PEP_ID=MMETSP0794_2-20130614/49967_1 /TAXON_ID=515487 /ORGANISM="Stephanopyxis turris, Strain CCMP 815" /LENGTH=294 /DNA_ID=CAMNT_0040673291 /DNA_START=99 /DNA_END=984 /DNA_ORIENTATION=+
MEENREICPDEHRCLNGAKCVEDDFNEGTFFCDCEMLGSDSEYAGLYCEHKSTQFCRDALDPDSFGKEDFSARLYCEHKATQFCSDALDPDSFGKEEFFCTNFADCYRASDVNGKITYGCDCPIGYVGDRCQFVEGTSTSGLEESSLKSTLEKPFTYIANETGMPAWEFFLVVYICLSIFAMIALLVRYVMKRHKNNVPILVGRVAATEMVEDMVYEKDSGKEMQSMDHSREAHDISQSANSNSGVEMTEDMVNEGEKNIIDVDGSKKKKKKKKTRKKSGDSFSPVPDNDNEIV